MEHEWRITLYSTNIHTDLKYVVYLLCDYVYKVQTSRTKYLISTRIIYPIVSLHRFYQPTLNTIIFYDGNYECDDKSCETKLKNYRT